MECFWGGISAVSNLIVHLALLPAGPQKTGL